MHLIAAIDNVIAQARCIEQDCSPHAPEIPYDLAVAIDHLERAAKAVRADAEELL